MQLKSTCKRIYNIPTKIVTQDIPWETLIEGKNPASKSIHHNVLFRKKYHCNTTMEAFKAIATTEQSMWTSMNPHIPCHASNAPLANLSSLVLLDSFPFAFFHSLFSHNYPCGFLYNSKSDKTTKWYYINHVLPNPLNPHLILEI